MKNLVFAFVAALALVSYAGPHPCGPGPRPGPWHCSPPHHHHGHHNDWVAPLVGFAAGAAVGSIVASSARPAVQTTVVQTVPVQTVPAQPTVVVAAPPVGYVNQQVWVPGCYTDVIQPNGAVVRTWTPGHWENRVVPVAQ